jgi:hypothetical protein
MKISKPIWLNTIKEQFGVSQKFFLALGYSLIIGILFGIGVLAIYDTFGNKKQDVTSISLYYPFAIFAACGAICFSWVRAVDSSQTVKIQRIRICAENFLLSAILFLMASLFKYFSIHNVDYSNKMGKVLKNFFLFMDWIFPLFLLWHIW